MAIDHALARTVEDGVEPDMAVLRLYRWARPTISFGRNQPARGLFDVDAAERRGVAFVRRPTGGRAVLHHEELTYAVVVPVDACGGLRPGYRLINEALVAGLRLLGLPAALAMRAGRALPPDAGPCFREPAAGEVVSRSAVSEKLAGSAQLRVGRTLLQHGSIPLSRSQALLEALVLPGGSAEPAPRVPRTPAPRSDGGGGRGGLEEILGRDVSWEVAADAIRTGFLEVFPGAWQSLDRMLPRPVVVEPLRSHYASSEWTWRL